MKKIIFIFIILLSGLFVGGNEGIFACEYNGGSLVGELEDCLNDADLVQSGNAIIESGVKDKIKYWTATISNLLGLLAVGAIVYGGLLMTLAGGEDEKIKKGKDVVKWSLLGFLAVVMIGSVIRVIVELVFDIAS